VNLRDGVYRSTVRSETVCDLNADAALPSHIVLAETQ